jgi:prepilin peptidase CpaA
MLLAQSAEAAFWLALGAAPIALWVVWTDLATMKIPNAAVLALVGVYAVIGALTLPLAAWAWSWLHLAVVLVIGFVLSQTGGFGAGDAKFAAAMAPFVALADTGRFLILLSALAILTFALHRIARRVPALRRATPGWASWERRDFPFGLALAPALIVYLALAARLGS